MFAGSKYKFATHISVNVTSAPYFLNRYIRDMLTEPVVEMTNLIYMC